MADSRSRQVVIAGAGIAGLTAALAFAARGFPVRLFERAPRLEEIGAGLQISPNATRILDSLGVLPALRDAAVQPQAVVLRSAATLAELTRVPLGAVGERRWGAPYLVVHRADLQSALLARAEQEPRLDFVTNAAVRDVAFHKHGLTASVDTAAGIVEAGGLLLVGADGVWSALRDRLGGGASRFAGRTAWRRTLRADAPKAKLLRELGAAEMVTAFLHRRFHVVAYPMRGGSLINLAAFTTGTALPQAWSATGEVATLAAAMAGTALAGFSDAAADWTRWPVHVAPGGAWTDPRGLALIGDAAHAMTPFAAQGAAMAIEDAWTLAERVAASPGDLAAALGGWERQRRPRIARVARRGAVNELAWHAGGPVALARNLVLRLRPGTKLASDLDWLYGFDATARDAGAGG